DFRTNLPQNAFWTIGLTGKAHLPPMKNHAMAEHRPFFFWNERHQVLLHLVGIDMPGKSHSVAEAEDMGIDRDAGNVKSIAQNHVGGLSPNSRQLEEVGHCAGNFSTVLF